MRMLTALNALGTIVATATPHAQTLRYNTCANLSHPTNYIDPDYTERTCPRYILSEISHQTARPFNVNKFIGHANVHEDGEQDLLAYKNFGHAAEDQHVALDGTFATSLWLNRANAGWGGLINPPGWATKIKFTFKDTLTEDEQSYTLYYNTGSYGNPIYSFVGIMPNKKWIVNEEHHSVPTLNYTYMQWGYEPHTSWIPRMVAVPSIFGHRVAFTDFHLTAEGLGLHKIWPYMAATVGGADGVHGNYTGNYLSGFKWNLLAPTTTELNVPGPEGINTLKNVSYDLAMHMYQELNAY